ncbi:hypothetical protein RD792_009359 [Penstemon davidsonii]|uniref:Flavin-containing monooxygenase n=1 Tax=Penstemon davidsonii TaxID=160366 RepID=A0ABR0CYU6_9LAMI|nr:hypothetical protein RD792_009359 [Penstemon davidsonii]
MAEEEQLAIIVGAGPSGLATAAYFEHLKIPYTLLEREDCFASIWKKYSYDRVHLHLPKQFCELPLMPIPSSFPTYLSRKEFIHYLNDYVSHFEIKPIYGRLVETASYDEALGKWKVKARDDHDQVVQEYWARFLVVATGETCDATIPKIEGLDSFTGKVLHSTKYKNGEEFKDKNVLVVGSGNSGMEIALDLANYGANASILVRSPIHILSRTMTYMALVLLKYLAVNWVDSMVTIMSKVVFGDLTKYGIQRPKEEGPFTMKIKYGKYPVIDVGTLHKIKSGEIQVLPAGIKSIRGGSVAFEDGKEYSFDAIVFATGFKRSTKEWLKGDDYLLNDDGLPKPSFPNHWKGQNGLYCAGLSRRGLYGSAMDAQKIANDIKALIL